MKYGFSLVGMTVLGLLAFAGIMLFTEITVSNEEDYYSLKDSLQAAMLESVDLEYYRTTGELKIIQEKVVENFTRRFIENSLFNTTSYNIEFYDIMESPPKVTVVIKDESNSYNITAGLDGSDAQTFTIINNLTGILEYSKKSTTELYYYGKIVPRTDTQTTSYLNIDFNNYRYRSIYTKPGMKISNITVVGPIDTDEEKEQLLSNAASLGISDKPLAVDNITMGSRYDASSKKLYWQQRYEKCENASGCLIGIVFRIEWVPTS